MSKNKPTRSVASRRISSKTSLANLKKEAKRWLRQLQAGEEAARSRLLRTYPESPSKPTLRAVQFALAREYGFSGWAELKKELEELTLENHTEGADEDQRRQLINQFLEYACVDPILCNGPAAHARRENAALRILNRYPWIARANIHTAVVCGDLEQVKRILKKRPEAAVEQGGPQRRRHLPEREKLWTPLLHLCYGRLPTSAASENALDIARLLLDRGANPNDFFECGSHPCRYTLLCGVAAEGEDDGPPHPRKQELARLLLERGAEPYDIQLLYNTHFHSDILWLMELIYEFSLKAGRKSDWEDPDWPMIDMGGYGSGSRYLLGNAVTHNKLELAEWLLQHGASPNSPPSSHPRAPKTSVHEEALRRGLTEMAELLVRYGATPAGPIASDGIEAFTEACMRLDRNEAKRIVATHPEYLQSTGPIFAAVKQDKAEAVELLLNLGTPIEIEDERKTRPLHEAAARESFRVAKLLIDRGAELEPVELNWENTPLDFALYGNLKGMISFLSQYTRDVFRLAWIGNLERLREVLKEEPDLGKQQGEANTPLMWLPDDDARAKEIAELLLDNGADPTVRNNEGLTAADLAERRGLYHAASLLRSAVH